jgi:hypothetical protein
VIWSPFTKPATVIAGVVSLPGEDAGSESARDAGVSGGVASLLKERLAVLEFPALSACVALTVTCPSESALKSIAALKAPFAQLVLAVAAPELKLTVLPSSEQVPETAKEL